MADTPRSIMTVSTPYITDAGVILDAGPRTYDLERLSDDKVKALCGPHGVSRSGSPGRHKTIEKLSQITLETTTLNYKRLYLKALRVDQTSSMKSDHVWPRLLKEISKRNR